MQQTTHGQITTSIFLQEDYFSHHAYVKLLAYSFSSNIVQPSKFSSLIQSTKNHKTFPSFPKEHYQDPEYTMNK